jgi:hypothetical protein
MKAKKVPSRRTSSGRVMPPRRLKAASLMAQAIGETGFVIGSEGDCYCEQLFTGLLTASPYKTHGKASSKPFSQSATRRTGKSPAHAQSPAASARPRRHPTRISPE